MVNKKIKRKRRKMGENRRFTSNFCDEYIQAQQLNNDLKNEKKYVEESSLSTNGYSQQSSSTIH